MLQSSTQDIISIVRLVRGLAKQFPAAAPHVAKINDELRQIVAIAMKGQQPPEPSAPPM